MTKKLISYILGAAFLSFSATCIGSQFFKLDASALPNFIKVESMSPYYICDNSGGKSLYYHGYLGTQSSLNGHFPSWFNDLPPASFSQPIPVSFPVPSDPVFLKISSPTPAALSPDAIQTDSLSNTWLIKPDAFSICKTISGTVSGFGISVVSTVTSYTDKRFFSPTLFADYFYLPTTMPQNEVMHLTWDDKAGRISCHTDSKLGCNNF